MRGMKYAVATVTVMAAVSGFAGQELVKNGDFKTGNLAPWKLDVNHGAKPSKMVVNDGAVQIQCRKQLDYRHYRSFQQPVEIKPHTKYKLKLEYKAELKPEQSLAVRIDECYKDMAAKRKAERGDPKNGRQDKMKWGLIKRLKSSANWKKVSKTFETPSFPQDWNPYLKINLGWADTDVWLRNISLKEVKPGERKEKAEKRKRKGGKRKG